MSNSHILTGTIKAIKETETFSSGFSKREFIIETEGKFPQPIKFEVVKDSCSSLDSFNIGDSVEVSFNVRGNEYNGKYYVNLQAWKVIQEGYSNQNSQAAQQGTQHMQSNLPEQEEGDDIPF